MRKFKINYHFSFGMAVLFTVLTSATASAETSTLTIDTFNVVDHVLTPPTNTDPNQQVLRQFGVGTTFNFYQAPVGDPSVIIGVGQARGERDIQINQTVGVQETNVTVNGALQGGGRTGRLAFSAEPGVTSQVTISYDGLDGDSAINPSGLGGVDLTVGGHSNGLLLALPEVDQPTNLLITIWQNAEEGRKASQYLNQIGPVENGDPVLNKFVAFSDFVISEKADVTDAVMDFSNIGAVAYEFNVPGPGGSQTAALDFQISTAQTALQVIPEPASAVSFLIGSLGLCYFEAFRLRRKRRGMR